MLVSKQTSMLPSTQEHGTSKLETKPWYLKAMIANKPDITSFRKVYWFTTVNTTLKQERLMKLLLMQLVLDPTALFNSAHTHQLETTESLRLTMKTTLSSTHALIFLDSLSSITSGSSLEVLLFQMRSRPELKI